MNEALLREAASRFRAQQEERMRELLLSCDPARFESIVVELLVRAGLGVRGEVLGRTGDGGVDGVLYQDRIGLGVVYLQAKRWADPVGRPDVQKFVGALLGKGASQGVLLTTSRFTPEAIEFAGHRQPRVILLDGPKVSELMYDYNVGFKRVQVIEIKMIDGSLFDA